MPEFERFHDEHGERANVVALNPTATEPSIGEVRGYLERNGFGLPVASDRGAPGRSTGTGWCEEYSLLADHYGSMAITMRRFLLLLALLSLLFSCATGPEPADDAEPGVTEQPGEGGAATEAGEDADDRIQDPDDTEPPATDEGERDDSDLPALQLVNPSDPAQITRPRFLLSAITTAGRLASLEVELLSGPIASDVDGRPFETVDVSELPAEERVYRLPADPDPIVVAVPRGFVDGERYRLRLRGILEDGDVTGWLEIAPRLNLRIEPPDLGAASPTIDTSPALTVDSERAVEIVLGDGRSFSTGEGGNIDVPFDLRAGTYSVRARTVGAGGYLTRHSEPVELRVLPNAEPRPLWPIGGETSLTPRTGLHWRPIAGAIGYQARVRRVGDEAWQQLDPTSESFCAIAERFTPGDEYEWQVRAQNDAGTWFAWSATERFTTGSFDASFATIVRPGSTATVVRGYDGGSLDEQPVREIELTRSFQMAVTPLTNAELVELVTYASARGFVEIDSDGVRLANESRTPLVGIGRMEYGEQFGLRFVEGRLQAVPGYADHPAIGVTWKGAVQIANLLSFAEGEPLAYDDEGVMVAPESGGYRLPTEAEWEYAARGTTDRILPWGGSLSGSVSNYYRSFDPFEDVNEPFTRSGGPTSPVGYYDGSVRDGFQTASDASPFGIRDMVGNVWEWCYDRYDPSYYAQSPDTDPTGPTRSDFDRGDEAVVLAVSLDPNQRVVRGSAWNTRSPDVRLTNRGRYSEIGRSYSIGVRLVRSRFD